MNPFAYKDFRLYFGLRCLYTIATQIQITVIGFYVYAHTHSKLALAMIGLSEVIPALGLALYGGYMADRQEKRNLLLWIHAGLLLMALIMEVIAHLPGLMWLIYGVLMGTGFVKAFYEPVQFSVYAHSILPSLYARATSWVNLSWQGASIVGPVFGGLLYAYGGGLSGAYWVVVALWVICLGLNRSLGRVPGAEGLQGLAPEPIDATGDPADGIAGVADAELEGDRERSAVGNEGQVAGDPSSDWLAGLRYVWKEKKMLYAMTLDLFCVFFGGVTALLPVYALDILHVGASGLGMMKAVQAMGAALCMGLMVKFSPMDKPWRSLLVAVLGFGLAIIFFGLSRSYVLSLGALFVMGALDSVSVLIRGTLMQWLTPQNMRGRVAAVNHMFISSSAELGDFESGMMAAALGTVPAVVVGGFLTIGVAIFTWTKTRSWTQLTLEQVVMTT